MNNVMLDIETLGTKPGSVVLSIGAVYFDPDDGIGAEFYREIALESSQAVGMTIDADTLRWWLAEGKEGALRSILNGGNDPLLDVLLALTAWFNSSGRGNPAKVQVWGCGAGFDQVLVKDAYARVGLPVPWQFWNERCFRTLKALRPDIQAERVNNHNALSDARNQAEHACRLLRALR